MALGVQSKKPENIAIIMDGNGRWAKSHSFEITKGHKRGVEVVREIVEECVTQHINSLTLFAFSTENWTRPKTEISGIKNLIIEAIHEQLPELVEKKVKLSFFGNYSKFGSNIKEKILDAEKKTSKYKEDLRLNIALSYGGRSDIVESCKQITSSIISGSMEESDINEESILKFSQCPENNIDLLIRTGGDQRISNFLLYQIAYAEIIFLDKLWPDFTKLDLQDCIKQFSKVERRFGQRL